MMYVFTNHFLNPIDETDPLTATTSVIVPRWLDLLHCHFSFHTEHHLLPRMNSRYYPHLSNLLSTLYPDKITGSHCQLPGCGYGNLISSLWHRGAAPLSNCSAASFARTTAPDAIHPLNSSEINTGPTQRVRSGFVFHLPIRAQPTICVVPDAIQFLHQVTVSGGPTLQRSLIRSRTAS